MTIRKICIVLTTRGNYAKMRSTMEAISGRADLQLQAVVGGALLDPAYGDVRATIESDGFQAADTIDYIAAGKTLESVTESAGRCTQAMGRVLARLRPDFVLIIADRYESLSIAQAALCQNIRIAHLEGGEVSGSIDERIRHAISKLAHIHFPASVDAAERLLRMGEPKDAVHAVGTPSLDLLARIDLSDRSSLQGFLDDHGMGAPIDVHGDYIVVSQHPVVTEYDDAARQFQVTAQAVQRVGLPTVWILPNDEAGAMEVTGPLAALTDRTDPPVRRIGSLAFSHYAPLLKHARCLIGNSSSGIREGAFLGTPAVNVGSRQQGRARGRNVIDVGYESSEILAAARRQLDHGPYSLDTLYGNGHSGERIAAILATVWPALDKTIAY